MLSLKVKISLFQRVVSFLITRLVKGAGSEVSKMNKNTQKVRDAEEDLRVLKTEVAQKNKVSQEYVSTANRYIDSLNKLL